MFYHLLYPLREYFIGFNVVKYITFRTLAALFTAMLVYFVFGGPLIRLLARKELWQSVRDDGPIEHLKKEGTPTMGGILLWAGIIFSILLWGRLDNEYTWLFLGTVLIFFIVGLLDDWRKVILRDSHGLKARYKFPIEVGITIVIAMVLFDGFQFDTHLSIPFFKSLVPDLGWWYIPFAVFLIVGVANACNLTDGLDGLVAMPSIMSYATYGIFAYIAGHAVIASYLQTPFIPGSGELSVACGAVVGGLIGFLWFNAHPAQVFMGDGGALPLGAALALVAIVTKNELLLILVGGIFLLETISVIVQVISFKLTGKRVFKMAPVHHHFELKGWAESKVIVRFWIIALILALASLATLKLR